MASETPVFDALLAANPAIAVGMLEFMTLYDAAEVLSRNKPPHWDISAAYLRATADSIIKQAGTPEQLLRAIISSRPSVYERPQKEVT